jgi:pimeloyl-ACP methyl ester carboxylesterase
MTSSLYTWGNPTRPSLLLLHGFLANGSFWEPLAQALPDFYCLAPDLLGFGAAPPLEPPYHVAQQVTYILDLIDQHGLDRPWLVGHSYGGWVAAACAIAASERLGGLLLLAPAGIRDDAFAGRYRWLEPLLSDGPWIDGAIALATPLGWLPPLRQGYQTIRRARRAFRQQPTARQILRARSRPEEAIDTVERHLGQITVPTLVIAGDRDQTIPLWHCQTYAQGIANARLHVLPDTDHDLPQSRTQQIATALRAFQSDRQPMAQ